MHTLAQLFSPVRTNKQVVKLAFVDACGESGIVSNTDVRAYDGPWQQEIQQTVDRVAEEREPEAEDVAEELIISVPLKAPVKAVERA